MSKHTPGPYHVAKIGNFYSVWGPESDAPLAEIHTGPTAEADAHLFTTAPKLLEACHAASRELLKWSNDPHFESEDGGDYSVALRLISDAIREADPQ